MPRILTTLLLLTLQLTAQDQTPIEERWVLSENKEQFLKTLTPGTTDFYFYHALHLQNTGQRDAFIATIDKWHHEYKNDPNIRTLEKRFTQLKNRQALLDYESNNPEQQKSGLNTLKQTLNLRFSHDKPLTKEEQKNTPSSITPEQITEKNFLSTTSNNKQINQLRYYTEAKTYQLLQQNIKLTPTSRKSLLKKLTRADIPALHNLISRELSSQKPLQFKQIAATRNLSLTQLKSLAKTHPKLLNQTAFINLTLNRLQPENPTLLTRDPSKKIAHLRTLVAFTQTLPQSQNSLKAHTLHHLLKTTSEQDIYDLPTFITYLQYPRSSGPLFKKENKRPTISISASQATQLPKIKEETTLIENQLNHFLTNPTSVKKLTPFFTETFLTHRKAIANLLAQKWQNKSTESWNKRFNEVAKQADQIANNTLIKPKAKKEHQTQNPTWSATLTADNKIQITHKNIDHLDLKIYPIDLELLFSKNPFNQANNNTHNLLTPQKTIRINLTGNQTTQALPPELTSGNQLLVIQNNNQTWQQTLHSTNLKITTDKSQGILQITGPDNKPLPKTYIKIYAETQNGQIIFYKDGHTDLRGIFNYRAHNKHPQSAIKRYAILTSHPTQGTNTTTIK